MPFRPAATTARCRDSRRCDARRLVPALAAVILALLTHGRATAGTLDVPTQYATIQSAIDAAQEGDVIRVGPGSYRESLLFRGRGVELRSTDGPEATVIQALPLQRIVQFSAGEPPTTLVTGFTFEFGRVDSGAAIFVVDASPRIEGNVFHDNRTDGWGGAIFLRRSRATIRDNVFTENEGRGGAVYVDDASEVVITDNTFIDHRSSTVRAYDSSVLLARNHIEDSLAYNLGGAIHLENCHAIVRDNTIFDSESVSGGGSAIVARDCPELQLVGNTIRDNRIGGSAPFGPGGAVLLHGCTFEMRDNAIHGNFSWRIGGGVCIEDSNGTLTANTIANNVTGFTGGGIAVLGTGTVRLDGNHIHDNRAHDGGGVFVAANRTGLTVLSNDWIHDNDATGDGGGVLLEAAAVLVHETITGNTANDGTGIAFEATAVPATVTNSIVYGNGPFGWNEIRPLVVGARLDVRFSCVRDGYPGAGNIDADPRFVDAANDDFHLALDSPCIDRGTDRAPHLPARDIDGDPRPVASVSLGTPRDAALPNRSTRVDLGADEAR